VSVAQAANVDTAIPSARSVSHIGAAFFPWNWLNNNGYPVASVGAYCVAPHTHVHGTTCAMPNFINLPPFTEGGDVHVVVETPRGSRAKFAYDPKLDSFTLSKSLLTGLTYPHDWGFVPSTKADDGDPLDIMVIHDAATFPGIVLTCRIIGILQIEQKSKRKAERNDRLFAVPRQSHSEQAVRDVRDLSKPIQQELEKFFIATDELEDKKLEIIGWKGPKAAMKAIKESAKAFSKNGE
jgi:inorganic pyrophosphatase